MTALYCRVSTLDQKTDRQRVNEKEYKMVIEDRCSGAVPFFDREGGKQILNLVEKKALKKLAVTSIDRLGRNLRDILNTIHFFNEKGVSIQFITQGLITLDDQGKENPISKMMISILGTLGEMERTQIKERQREGIAVAKLKGNKYNGRPTGTKEDIVKFLSKKKNASALTYMKRGLKAVEVSKLTGLHINTLTKIRKLGLPGKHDNMPRGN